jgi:hypothetical protein
MAERLVCTQHVGGSSPSLGSILRKHVQENQTNRTRVRIHDDSISSL